eukprot:CAMPEP_0184682720 /NCGR_PEP_ID=MMETSP0312-20130426/8504_1 /TAXON_ID=31354 /ORGANISM="Compsopogon coeruleus, Strain SAG 36.94" /LENGTH=807 /DNA_ID=CAMNT_0027134571 /DNA_START=96 /DNA_END=2519 /DNA_ORIENTATION=-
MVEEVSAFSREPTRITKDGNGVLPDDPFRVVDADEPAGGDDDRFSVDGSDIGGFMTDEDEEGVSLNLPRKTFTKLEVIQAHEITWLLFWTHAAVIISIITVVIVIMLSYLAWFQNMGPDSAYIVPPRSYKNFEKGWNFATFLYFVTILVIYSVRIARLKPRDRTHEQIWVCIMMAALPLYRNPYFSLGLFFADGVPVDSSRETLMLTLRATAFNVSSLFFIWTSIHSYRHLRGPLPVLFYLPKLLLLAVYSWFQVMGTRLYRLQFSELPLVSFISMLRSYMAAGLQKRESDVGLVIAYSLFEVFIISWIVREIIVTRSVLRQSDYMKFRSKQIGFRFFLYHNLVFYAVYWCLYVLLVSLLSYPKEFLEGLGVVYLIPWVYPLGVNILLMAYVTVEAFVKLPSDSQGLRGLFEGQRKENLVADETDPITYRKREPPSFSGAVQDLKSNVFVMQTQVIMFNFAWLVYYYGTSKLENFKLKQDVFKFEVTEFISNKSTDTHALVVDGQDRIVISFRGTTSLKNLRTDIKIKQVRTDSVLPTRKEWNIVGGIDYASAWTSPTFLRSRLHKGFVEAYCSVCERILELVKHLFCTRKRPIFVTGHSLGGSLATICSLDLAFSLGLGPRDIYVSTYGSPRPGNRAFRDVYNQTIPIHWRVIVGPDMIPKLPKIGYKHVGKKVLVTANGELFIDPNALELKLWHGQAASVLYHRKASYLLAMRAWCEVHHGDTYIPEFWPWPFSDDDSRRFEHALPTRSTPSSSLASQGLLQERHKLLARDAMVDALGNYPAQGGDAVARWARLTRKLIMKDSMA